MAKVLVLDPIHEAGLKILHEVPEIECVHLPDPTEPEIAAHLANAEVLVLRSRKLPRQVFERAGRLRLVSRHGVGCDNIDFDLMQQMGVTVAVAADSNYVSVAEHAMTLVLASLKRLPVADEAVRSANWSLRDHLGARELQGSKVLIVGFGRIGRAFASRVEAFGAACLVYDPFLSPDSVLTSGMSRVDTLEEGLDQADIVSLHLPNTSESVNLLDAGRLAQMRLGSILVNTARGGIVDEAALLTALNDKRPAIYATDVLASEPPASDDPLLNRPDVILTPHSAAMTKEAARRMSERSAQNAVDFLSGALLPEMTAFQPRHLAANQLSPAVNR
ncbi:hydroxyacid dehydrogenase [Algihabitans albus]|uniref:hydroxyacid dehydrogenase n=1 Tax=Algihabitans albus TaxID=2164067 RepID=UPI000E5C7D9D|nr:hydroxyacid dehydrogenase [Algihabitans albus]